MTDHPSPSTRLPPASLRAAVWILALVLAAQSVWILGAERFRPGLVALPASHELAAVAATRRGDAAFAARLAALRGDLWAEAALSYADLLWVAPPTNGPSRVDPLKEARASATQAIALAPDQPAVWLLLAGLASRYGWPSPVPAEALKMSYYTGPREDSLMPMRLDIAARLATPADPELSRLFRRDIELILTHRTRLKGAIAAAYRDATPETKRALEEEVGRLDPPFLESLRGGAAR